MADKSKNFIKRILSKILRKLFYTKSCKIIAVSNGIKDELINYNNLNKNKIVVINNLMI